MNSRADLCRCGHHKLAHEHHRAGTECALCPDGSCDRFQFADGPGRWGEQLRRLVGRRRSTDRRQDRQPDA